MSEAARVAYADTSALAKLVLVEPEGSVFVRHFAAHERVLTSAVGVVELVRAARRELGVSGERQAMEVVAGLTVVPLSAEVSREACGIPPALRALDAIHLASARVAGGVVGVFYCYDLRLCAAAAAAGFAVESPGA